ncbi:MFS transporter [Novosphingobium pentaromativorans]|nr:MFS transporter [Novosphingobium pentaromativorans]AIT81494.1 hypothetical protein JI59_17800 [Novosphingobium pentaromativorans US6-1]
MEVAEKDTDAGGLKSTPVNLRVGWMTVGILSLLTVLSVLDRSLLTLMVDPVMADLDLTETQMGALLGFAFGLFFFLGALPIGWALDRFSRPLVIWIGVTVWSIGTIGCGVAQSFSTFFASRAMVGSGEAVMGPGAQSLLPEFFPPEKLGFAFSVFSLSSSIGAGAAFAIGGLAGTLIDPRGIHEVFGLLDLRGWQLIFLMVGVPGLLMAFLIFLVPDPRRTKTTRTESTNYFDYFRLAKRYWRFLLPHHLGLLFTAGIAVAMVTWSPAFYQRVHGLSVGEVGAAMGVALTLGTVVALPIHARIVDRLYAKGKLDIHLRYMALSVLVAAPLAIATYAVSSVTLSLILFCLSKAFMCVYLSLPFVILQIVMP